MKNLLKLWKKYSYLLLVAFIVLGLFDMRFSIIAVVCMVAPIIVSFTRGRYWCGNLCPRGSFYDNIISKISKKRNAPLALKSSAFRLFMIVLLFSMFTLGIYQNWGDLFGIGFVFYRIIVVTTLVGILLSLFYNERIWCHFCPMGTISSFISRHRKNKKTLTVTTDCVSCKLCKKECSLGIIPYDFIDSKLSHPDCIQCGKCVSTCPKKAIKY